MTAVSLIRSLVVVRQHACGECTKHRVVGDRYIPAAGQVRLGMKIGVEHQINRYRLLRLRLEILDVDLSGDRFVAVDDRRGAFADLHGVHPRTRNILHTEGLRQSAHGRRVLRQQLHIRAAQAEHLDLLGTCGGVGIRHIHRGGCLKALAQVTTGGTAELSLAERLGVERREARLDHRLPACLNRHFVQLPVIGDKNDHQRGAVFDARRVVAVTKERRDKELGLTDRFDLEQAFGVGRCAYGRLRPPDVSTNQRVTFVVQNDTVQVSAH